MKGFSVHLLLIIAVIVLFLAGFFYFKTIKKDQIVSPYNNYKSYDNYSNSGLGFQFQHGQDFKILEDSEEEYNKRNNGDYRKNFTYYVGYEPPKLLKAISILKDQQTPEQSSFTIWVYDNPNNLDTLDWYDKFWYYPFQWGVFNSVDKQKLQPEKETTLSGQLAKYNIVSHQPGKPKYLYILSKDKMFLIRVLTDDQNGEQVLKTLKLL